MSDTTGPRVITPFPAHGAQNVAVNTLITAQFNEAVDPNSVTSNTIFVIQQNTFEPVDGTVSYVPNTRQAKFTPSSNLRSNTKYRAIVLGQEDPWSSTPVGIKDTNGNYMDGQYSWTFTTGGSTSSSVELAAIPSGTTGYENVTQPNPTGQIDPSTYLTILSTSPSHYESDLPVSTQITIDFNDALEFEGQDAVLGTLVLGEGIFSTPKTILDQYIEITNKEVLGTSAASQEDLIWDFTFNTGNNRLTIFPDSTSPAADANGSHWNNKGTYTKGARVYGVLEENNEYIVKIKSGLGGATTLPLQEEYVFLFTTQYDPRYASSVEIRLILGNLIEDIPDDTINRIIYQNGIYALHLYSPRLIGSTGLPWYIPKYVECKTALDLLHNKFLNLGGVGSRKVLADLTIDRGNQGRDIIALAESLMSDLKECVDAMEGLIISGGIAPQPEYAIPFKDDTRGPVRDETWRRLPKMYPKHSGPGPGRKSSVGLLRKSRNAGFFRRRNF